MAAWRNPVGERGLQKQTKASEKAPAPFLEVPQKHQITQL